MESARVLSFPHMGKRNFIYQGPNRAREYRKARKLTLQRAAPLVGLSWTHLARIETGERELNTIWMERLAKAYDCPPADLLSLEMGGLTVQERRWIDILRAMPVAGRTGIAAMIETQAQFLDAGEGADVLPFPQAV